MIFSLKAKRLTTPFTTQNRPKAARDFIGLRSLMRKTAVSGTFETQRVVAGTLGEPLTRSRQVKTLPPRSGLRLILHGVCTC
jgi:hypothetical protein